MTEKELNLTKAQNAVLSHDWGTAVRLYKLLLKDDETNIIYLKALGNVFVKAGDDEKAIPYYEQIIKYYPHDIEAMNSLGAIYRRIKQYQKSVEILKRAQNEQNISSVNYNLGFTFKEMGNYEDAIECFESVITENPDDVLTFNHLGSIYLLQKNYDKSINAFNHGLQVDQNHPILNYNLARCYAESKNYRESIKYFERALRTRPGWIEAVSDFSDVLVKCQKNSSAQKLVERTIKMHPQNAELLCILGNIFLSQFDYENAAKVFEKAEKIEPNDIKILMGFSEALEKGDKIEEALEKAVEAADISPLNADVRKRYIHTLLSAQKFDQALEHVKELEETEGDDLQVLDLYGQYYICRGDEAVANLYYNRIKERNQDYDDYILNASDRFMQIGNLDKAEEYAKKFVAKKEKVPEGYNQLGQIYVAKGEWNKAKSVLEKSSTFRNPNVLAKKRLERVNSEINNNPEFAQMASFDFSSLQKEDEIISSSSDMEANDFDVQENEDSFAEGIESLALTDSEAENARDEFGDEENLINEDDFTSDSSNIIEENDEFNQNDLQADDKNDNEQNQPVEIIESGNETEDFSDQEDADGEIFDEKTFDFSQFGDLTGLNETLSEDEEEFWNEFDDKDDDDNENNENNGEIVVEKEIFSEDLSAQRNVKEPSILKNDESRMRTLSPAALEEMSRIVDKATEITDNEIIRKQREIESQSAVLGALNSADTALQMAMKTQQMVKDLEEKQKTFEEEFVTKSEKMIQEAVEKKFEENVEAGDEVTEVSEGEAEITDEVTEVSGNEAEFAEVDEFASEETDSCEPQGDVAENEATFTNVDEFVSEEDVFADVDDFGVEAAETATDEAEFADVNEFCGDVSEFAGGVAETDGGEPEFADVDDFGGDENLVADEVTEVSGNEAEFAEVDEFASEETDSCEPQGDVAEDETAFTNVDEFASEEDVFADVDDFGVEAAETATDEAEFADVDEFSEETKCESSSCEVCDFKNLRAIFDYLPENGQDSFVSNRIRMVVEYVIAKTSGKRGLLKTAKMWRKAAHLDNYETQNDEDKVTAREIYDLVAYLKTLANELQDKQISKAICESADNVLQRIQLE